jgi:hypothetical protein
METIIRVTLPDGEHRLVARGAAEEPRTTARVPGRNGKGGPLLAVEVAIGPGGVRSAPIRPTDTGDIEALERAQEDAALDAEDVLTQAEEASAVDPVG